MYGANQPTDQSANNATINKIKDAIFFGLCRRFSFFISIRDGLLPFSFFFRFGLVLAGCYAIAVVIILSPSLNLSSIPLFTQTKRKAGDIN